MGTDVYVKNESEKREIGSCRGGGWQFWKDLFPEKNLYQGTTFPLKELLIRLEEEIKKITDNLTREELLEHYIYGGELWRPENDPIEIYKKIRDLKGKEDGYLVKFE